MFGSHTVDIHASKPCDKLIEIKCGKGLQSQALFKFE